MTKQKNNKQKINKKKQKTQNVGQCGIQLGNSVWEQYCAEHTIDKTGHKAKSEDNSFQCFYEESGSGLYVPRNISVDLEPNVIDDIRNGPFSKMFKFC